MPNKLEIELTKDGDKFLTTMDILDYPLYGLGNTPTEAFFMIEKEAKSLLKDLKQEKHLDGDWLARESVLKELFD